MNLYSKLLFIEIAIGSITAALLCVSLASRNSIKDDFLLYFGLMAGLFVVLDFIACLVLFLNKSTQHAYNSLLCAITLLLFGIIALSNAEINMGF